MKQFPPTTPQSDEALELRSERAIRHAVGQQALEGLTVPADAIVEMRRAGRGEIPVGDVINCFYKRYPNAQVFRPR